MATARGAEREVVKTTTTTVVVEQRAAAAPKEEKKKKKSFLKSLNKQLDSLGKDMSKAVDSVSTSVNKGIDSHWASSLLDNFRSGNVVQLLSRSSGKALQIVMSPTGMLVVDGMGPEGPTFLHAHWTLLNEGKNIVRLHNQNNYLAIVNGTTCLMQFPDPSMCTPETRFRIQQAGNFARLASVKEPKCHVGILPDGTLKSALASGTEMHSQFGVRLIFSPHPPTPAKAQAQAQK